MDRGLYIAASGMLAELARQDQLTNDLANSDTAGYKADRVTQTSFGDVLLHNTRTGAEVGPMGQGVSLGRSQTDTTPEALKQTDEPLDVGIDGDGWFAVQTAEGRQYTRNGAFTADAGGRLVDQMGNAVLGQDGRPVQVGADGKVDVARIGVFALGAVRKEGDGYVTGATASTPVGKARTGYLEGSGVDPTRTVVDLMASLRAYEAGQKALTTIDDSLRQANRITNAAG